MGIQSCPNTGLGRHAFDFKNDPAEIYETYAEDALCLLPALERLAVLKGYDEMHRILCAERERLLSSTDVYRRIADVVLGSAAEASACSKLEQFVVFFIDLVSVPRSPFQIFLVCRTVSDLIVQNTRFPSRAHTIKYFRYVAMLFKKAESFYNYLNSLQILDTLESVRISEREFLFLRECASIKREPGCKELFCGLKMTDLDKIFTEKSFSEDEFVENENWKRLIALKRESQATPLDVDFMSFLKKNSILFELRDGSIHVGSYAHTGFATKIYGIVRAYEVRRPRGGPPATSVQEDGEPARQASASLPARVPPASKPVSEFVDRFSQPYRKFRWLYAHASNRFVDDCFEERNRNRHAAFLQASAAYEERKAQYAKKKDTIEQLSILLNKKIKEKHEEDYQKAQEAQRQEAERMKAERKAQMWSTKRSVVQSATSQRPGQPPGAEGSAASQAGSDYLPPHLKGKSSSDSSKGPGNK